MTERLLDIDDLVVHSPTLGRTVLGLAPVNGGTIRCNGRDISHLSGRGRPDPIEEKTDS